MIILENQLLQIFLIELEYEFILYIEQKVA